MRSLEPRDAPAPAARPARDRLGDRSGSRGRSRPGRDRRLARLGGHLRGNAGRGSGAAPWHRRRRRLSRRALVGFAGPVRARRRRAASDRRAPRALAEEHEREEAQVTILSFEPRARCPTAGSSAATTERRGDRRGPGCLDRAARDRGAQLLDLRLRRGAALGGAREARPAQRPGRALPHRHVAHMVAAVGGPRRGSAPTSSHHSGSTPARSSRSPRPSFATGSTRRTCSPA